MTTQHPAHSAHTVAPAPAPGTVRVRFAPSPTGFLHIGGVRAALFNWLYARRHQGKFLLRIEDTDLERSEDRYTQDIKASMQWLGLNWDEEPIFQSRRLPHYMEKAQELVAKGHAYWCACTEADVEKMRETATAAGTRPQYDRTCRSKKLSAPKAGESAVIRAAIPLEGGQEFMDLIRGPIRVENTEVDDFVLIRSNGAPTYNLSCVVDDVESRMTHVIRGDDHINNTPKQTHLYRFFDYPLPQFVHLPMILGADKKKLSKRHGAVSANVYRAEGYLPETMLNFLARLGWSHGDQEIFTVGEMIEMFSFDHVQRSSGVFNSEKLLWLNGEHMRRADPKRLAGIVAEDFTELFTASASVAKVTTDVGVALTALIQQKVKLVKELADQLIPLCTPGAVELDPAQVSALKWNKDPAVKASVKDAVKHATDDLAAKMAKAPAKSDSAWGNAVSLGDIGMSHADIDAYLRQICEQKTLKLGDLASPMRLAVSGRAASAGLFDLMAVLPWTVVEARLRKVDTL
ncbi:MAG: glutamate--tRNA ligase [Methylotenera sp.]|nr:glutamate--tRNA ligase [Oligoflexia bacterium]